MEKPDCQPLFALMPTNRLRNENSIPAPARNTRDAKALGQTRRKINDLLDELELRRQLRDI